MIININTAIQYKRKWIGGLSYSLIFATGKPLSLWKLFSHSLKWGNWERVLCGGGYKLRHIDVFEREKMN